MSLLHLPLSLSIAENPFKFSIQSASRQIFKEARLIIPESPPSDQEVLQKEEDPLNQLKLIELLDKSKSTIYLAYSPLTDKQYAVKLFEYDSEGNPSYFYKQEVKFMQYDHKNILKIVRNKDHAIMKNGELTTKSSLLVLEYAPHGDFNKIFLTKRLKFSEKLARTYFHQLIQALEYLHERGVYHLDIKPSNLLIGKNYQLLLGDFDGSYIEGENKSIKGRGSKFFRSLELLYGTCTNPAAADICSAGFVLFWIVTSGHLAQHEENVCRGAFFMELLFENKAQFWKMHLDIMEKKNGFFSKEFKELFVSMVNFQVKQRATLQQVKESAWFKGEVYSDEELSAIMEEMVDDANRSQNEQRLRTQY